MPYLIGTDEAGYAPNLGPLVISATVWQVDCDAADDRLYDLLSDVICDSPGDAHGGRAAWADSKVLYAPAQGLAVLERGLLAALALVDRRPVDWRALWETLDEQSAAELDAMPWHVGYNADLPLSADEDDLDDLTTALATGFSAAGVRLIAIESRAVFPDEFNRLVQDHGNKSEVLSRLTLGLIARQLGRIERAPVRILCDKHGGRNRYGPLLQRQFPEHLVEVREEGSIESMYAWGPADSRIEVRFRMQCEEFLPVALASMASKYLREAAMLAFNQFWRGHLPEIRPTAGYPTDARRFKQEIQTVQSALGIADRQMWRER